MNVRATPRKFFCYWLPLKGWLRFLRPLFACMCWSWIALDAAAQGGNLASQSGVTVSTPAEVPQAYKDKLGDLFLDDLGGGAFTQNWQVSKDPKDLRKRFHLFVKFDIDLPSCRQVGLRQWVKVYRFIKQSGPKYRRQKKPDGSEQTDNPPKDKDNNFQAPGEVYPSPGGGFNSYDIPGMGTGSGMPDSVTGDRIRMVFKTIVRCNPGPSKTFYWMVELTIPYQDGLPRPESGSGSAKQISEKDYKNAAKSFGQDH